MTVDPINKSEIYFPSYSGSNESLLILLNRTSKIMCKWFSDSEKLGPIPIDYNFDCSVPDENGMSADVLFLSLIHI